MFALQFARPAPPDPDTPYTYDAVKQLNTFADGIPAVRNSELLLTLGTTTSTAGSKTHFDD